MERSSQICSRIIDQNINLAQLLLNPIEISALFARTPPFEGKGKGGLRLNRLINRFKIGDINCQWKNLPSPELPTLSHRILQLGNREITQRERSASLRHRQCDPLADAPASACDKDHLALELADKFFGVNCVVDICMQGILCCHCEVRRLLRCS